MSDEQWGPWVNHNGLGCPEEVIGRMTQCEGIRDKLVFLFRDCPAHRNWLGWFSATYGKPVPDGSGTWDSVIRYRVRKPRGMSRLEEIITEIDQRETEAA